MSEDADWWIGKESKDVTAVQPVQAIAIYKNNDGDIIIRQASEYGEEDNFIMFKPVFKKQIINALKAIG